MNGSPPAYSYGQECEPSLLSRIIVFIPPLDKDSFCPRLYYEGLGPPYYNPDDENQMDLGQSQLPQANPSGITIEELTDKDEVQIHTDGNGSYHQISPVSNFGGDTIPPLHQSQLPGYQVDYPHMQLVAQPVIPLTGRSNETTIRIGTPGYVIGNIANAAGSVDPHVDLTVRLQGMVEKLSESPCFNADVLKKMLRRCAKDTVTSCKARLASEKRRTDVAKFLCGVEGCNSRFTRKHNLISGLISVHWYLSDFCFQDHLKSHLGIADYFCPKCQKGFTTCATMKRHATKCSPNVASSSEAPMTPEALAQIQKVVRSSLNQS